MLKFSPKGMISRNNCVHLSTFLGIASISVFVEALLCINMYDERCLSLASRYDCYKGSVIFNRGFQGEGFLVGV